MASESAEPNAEPAVVEPRPRSLEHPLPAGMRDLLPAEAAARRVLSRTVLERFGLFGYRVVTPPAFELADVVERGLGPLAAADVLRFIEPESGDVAVLRPDMTPQIARIVATRLRDHALPIRLAYEGTVVRRKAGRAKKHRQFPQAGVELCGVADASGDLELLALAAATLRATGLERFTIDVSDAGIVRALLEGVPPRRADAITHALSTKDEARLAEHVRGLPAGDALMALPRLHGGRDALVLATKLLESTPARAPALRLLALFDAAVREPDLATRITVDVGEVRGFAYYTGTIFSIYADGPGAPIGAGGRYDELLSRFGVPMPAVGFGLDLDALALAQRAASGAPAVRTGIVVVGEKSDATTRSRVEALRALGVAAVALATADAARAYARSWSFAAVWDAESVVDAAAAPGAPIALSAVPGASGASSEAGRAEAVARFVRAW